MSLRGFIKYLLSSSCEWRDRSNQDKSSLPRCQIAKTYKRVCHMLSVFKLAVPTLAPMPALYTPTWHTLQKNIKSRSRVHKVWGVVNTSLTPWCFCSLSLWFPSLTAVPLWRVSAGVQICSLNAISSGSAYRACHSSQWRTCPCCSESTSRLRFEKKALMFITTFFHFDSFYYLISPTIQKQQWYTEHEYL